MATRKIVASEKAILENDDSIGSSPAANEKSNISPAVPTYVSLNPLAPLAKMNECL
jgi:vacuolar ATPase assembly integral membrane protein VMA21